MHPDPSFPRRTCSTFSMLRFPNANLRYGYELYCKTNLRDFTSKLCQQECLNPPILETVFVF